MRFDQGELAFSEEDHPWLRRAKEPARAYSAFALYRDLGLRRTLIEALRQYRAQNGVTRRGEQKPPSGVPAAWRKWRSDWAWDERLAAFDKHSADIEAAIEAEAEDARLKIKVQRRREHDEGRYHRLVQLASRLDALVLHPLVKSRIVKKTGDGARVEEQDYLKEFVALSEEEHRTAEAYFRESSTPDSGEPQIPMIGEFRWIPDPEVPPAPANEGSVLADTIGAPDKGVAGTE
jgi:hypothetical protein